MSPTSTVTTQKTKVATGAELRSFGPEASLQVDLYSASVAPEGSAEARQDLQVPPSAVAMVNDLIAVIGGEIRTTGATRIQAEFKNTLQAVKAVRHLQSLFRGFSKSPEGTTFSVCFTLTRIGDLANLASDSRVSSMEHSQPGRVLFRGNICRDARSIPGLQLKEIPQLSSASGGLQAPCFELLPPSHLTELVDDPIQAQSPAQFTTTLRTSAVNLPLAQNNNARAKSSFIRNALASVLKLGGIKSFAKGLMDHARDLPRWFIPVGVATVALLTILGLALYPRPSSTSKRQPSQVDPRSKAVSPAPYAPAAQVPASPSETNETKGNNPLPKIEKIPEQKESVGSDEETVTQQRRKEDDPSTKATKGSGNLSSAEINMTMSEADKLAGDGEYDKAIELYNIVLKHDPKNVAARQGKSRAEHNKIR